MTGKLNAKEISFWVIGLITLVYCIVELAIALFEDSLTLLSDGFHNLSDVISLYIAFYASKAARRGKSDDMSYGWGRTEILGALTNGVFLLSLVLYTSLEAIPLLFPRQAVEEPAGLYFVAVAAAGLVVNTVGTVVFAVTGQAHGHSHAGGGGHGHSHGGHGHAHGGDEHEEDHGHSHNKKKDHGHSHASAELSLLGDDDDHDDHGHGHGGAHDHGHGKAPKPAKKRDMNVHAVFLHYLGDMISSFFVLIAGILLLIFEGETWVEYIDPVTSLLICLLILITTLPLVRNCLHILLQSVPKHIELPKIKNKITKVEGVIGLHDFHVWQLTDGMIISSMHVVCEEGCNFPSIAKKTKKILHKNGIHSTAIQPEFVALRHASGSQDDCTQNCVENCKEDWCCKKPDVKKTRSTSGNGGFNPQHEEIL